MDLSDFASVQRFIAAQQAHEGHVRSLACEDAEHAYSHGMSTLDALTWVVDRSDEHGLRGDDRGLFSSTFVDHLVSLVAMEVGR